MSRWIKALMVSSAVVFVSYGSSYADAYTKQIQDMQAKCNNNFTTMNRNASSDEQRTIADNAMRTYKEREGQLLRDVAQGRSSALNERISDLAGFCKQQTKEVFYKRKKPIGMKWD